MNKEIYASLLYAISALTAREVKSDGSRAVRADIAYKRDV